MFLSARNKSKDLRRIEHPVGLLLSPSVSSCNTCSGIHLGEVIAWLWFEDNVGVGRGGKRWNNAALAPAPCEIANPSHNLSQDPDRQKLHQNFYVFLSGSSALQAHFLLSDWHL